MWSGLLDELVECLGDGWCMAGLLRCAVGYPWQQEKWAVSATTKHVAMGLWERREWWMTGILADALQDDGCQDEAALEHLRGSVHGRCCWVVKRVLEA